MKMNSIALAVCILLLSFSCFSQTRLSGFVIDSLTGEHLIGAYITEQGTNNGTSTDNNGYFTLITQGKPLNISYIGYNPKQIGYTYDSLLSIKLVGGKEIEEITVTGRHDKQFNMATLSNKEMVSIPSLGAKPDVLKALQLLPGIQPLMEGTSLLSVRGGNPGENLYLIDNIPLIYVNHLGGFISVFNPDMINNIEVYKGGFPAKYGGKLSSVVSITQREGNISETKMNLGIGVTDASFDVEGPFKNKKATYLITGRKTMIDPLMLLVSGLAGQDYYMFYGFHDLNGKVSWKPDPKNSIYINLYYGDDYIRYWSKRNQRNPEKNVVSNIWGNWLIAAHWNRVISSCLFVDNIMSYTRYRYITKQRYELSSADTTSYLQKYASSVQDLSLRSDWKYKVQRNWSLDFGAKATQYVYIPNKIIQSSVVNSSFERIPAYETGVYASNRARLFNCIETELGIRAVNYFTSGLSNFSLESRFSMNIELSHNHTFNLSAQKVSQYAHLVLTSGSILANEVWIPSDKQIAPGRSEQFSVAWKGNYFNGMLQSELGIYYKTLTDLSSYREGYTTLLGDGGWRDKIESGGKGETKGAEFLIRKTKGKWTGLASYTWSHSTRQYPDINDGETYLYEYDRPHTISFYLNKQINSKWTVNLVWVYQTGLPYTPVIGRMLDDELEESLIYGKRNSARMRDYHRMDVGLTYTKQTKYGRKAEWNFSVYNLYNRHNPNAYYYNTSSNSYFEPTQEGEDYKPLKLYQVSFFPIIPTVSYKVYFDMDKNKKTSIGTKIKKFMTYGE